jgi:hypothetical protein
MHPPLDRVVDGSWNANSASLGLLPAAGER